MAQQQEKKAAKGQKIGRNKRAPSNAMQARRTERNKRLALERAHDLKMKQMPVGGKSLEIYGPHERVDPAAKYLAACRAVFDAKLARIAAQRAA